MRDKLKEYVSLLFAGAPGAEDVQEEILQNTLDRFDDLVAQGKSPEAAYRLAITGIGDLSEILATAPTPMPAYLPETSDVKKVDEPVDSPMKALGRTFAIGMYILSPLPLFILSEFGMSTVGLCGTISIVAVATVLLLLCKKNEPEQEPTPKTRENAFAEGISSLIWAIGFAVYFILSFVTNAWHITWLVFPITGAVCSLVKAIFDLKEEQK